MAAQKEKKEKRSWGRTKHKEVTVINQEKIEETLQSLAEEVKQRELASSVSYTSSASGAPGPAGAGEGVDLQYPELMSDDALAAVLKRIKVPIPVYPDGRPSRERLLYLFKTNVLPRPQRNQRKRKRQLRDSAMVSRGDDGGTAMEVDDWSTNGAQTNSSTEIQRKRPLADTTDDVAAKRLSIDPSLSDNQAATISPVTPSPTLAMGTLNLQDGIGTGCYMHRVKLKRRSSSTTGGGNTPSSPSNLVLPKAGLPPGNRTSSTETGHITSPDAVKKVCRAKITWP